MVEGLNESKRTLTSLFGTVRPLTGSFTGAKISPACERRSTSSCESSATLIVRHEVRKLPVSCQQPANSPWLDMLLRWRCWEKPTVFWRLSSENTRDISVSGWLVIDPHYACLPRKESSESQQGGSDSVRIAIIWAATMLEVRVQLHLIPAAVSTSFTATFSLRKRTIIGVVKICFRSSISVAASFLGRR